MLFFTDGILFTESGGFLPLGILFIILSLISLSGNVSFKVIEYFSEYSLIISCALVTGIAPCFIKLFVPKAKALVTWPGIAKTSLFWLNAVEAVISAAEYPEGTPK